MQADTLQEENQLLRHAMALLQQELEAGGAVTAAAHCAAVLASVNSSPHDQQPPGVQQLKGAEPPQYAVHAMASASAMRQSYRQDDTDSDTISLMSLNESVDAEAGAVALMVRLLPCHTGSPSARCGQCAS